MLSPGISHLLSMCFFQFTVKYDILSIIFPTSSSHYDIPHDSVHYSRSLTFSPVNDHVSPSISDQFHICSTTA